MNNTALGILSALFILVGSWVLSWTNFCGGTVDSPANFLFTDGAFKTKGVDAFSFQKSGSFLTLPVATSGEFKKIAAHFKSNENRTLSLVGNYYASEKYTGDSNLGKERADAIKAKLVQYGVSGDRIITSGKELTGDLTGKKLYNAVVFEGNEMEVEEKVGAPVEIKFSPLKPHTVYFDSGTSKLEMTTELQRYLDQALEHLKQNSGTVLLLTGYTDNYGGSKNNKILSKDRARKLRTFLYKNGVKKGQVNIQGLGEKNPIAPNDTDEGKALNRRVEITVK